jgi:hypothetical protein
MQPTYISYIHCLFDVLFYSPGVGEIPAQGTYHVSLTANYPRFWYLANSSNLGFFLHNNSCIVQKNGRILHFYYKFEKYAYINKKHTNLLVICEFIFIIFAL